MATKGPGQDNKGTARIVPHVGQWQRAEGQFQDNKIRHRHLPADGAVGARGTPMARHVARPGVGQVVGGRRSRARNGVQRAAPRQPIGARRPAAAQAAAAPPPAPPRRGGGRDGGRGRAVARRPGRRRRRRRRRRQWQRRGRGQPPQPQAEENIKMLPNTRWEDISRRAAAPTSARSAYVPRAAHQRPGRGLHGQGGGAQVEDDLPAKLPEDGLVATYCTTTSSARRATCTTSSTRRCASATARAAPRSWRAGACTCTSRSAPWRSCP